MESLCEAAKLYLEEEEKEKLFWQIGQDVEKAKALAGYEGQARLLERESIDLREDTARDSMGREEALDYAAEREYGYFQIKRIID